MYCREKGMFRRSHNMSETSVVEWTLTNTTNISTSVGLKDMFVVV